MNEIIEQYWARALKITRQYEAGEVNFADLTGLGDEFAASFIEQLNEMPEPLRARYCAGLETKLSTAIAQNGPESPAAQAFNELRVSITRTPIY
ncbi:MULTISPECIES: hypothetical protein [Pusillimonas]|uniref:hypothetical protein n=1 Tax=Pusillimonas TaxID=305976 RepID=UPI000E5A08C4|nr:MULTISPECIES: hypothetical protein [Pusillimonas]MDX3896080.1 hypothetical protein [Pusillimonas sp.]TFL10235.1 hypothetical protein CSC67_17895 [Pusillimonas caeni]